MTLPISTPVEYDAAALVGLSLTELAVDLGVARERARLLVEAFVAAGVVVEQEGGRLVVVDAEISVAFEDWTGLA